MNWAKRFIGWTKRFITRRGLAVCCLIAPVVFGWLVINQATRWLVNRSIAAEALSYQIRPTVAPTPPPAATTGTEGKEKKVEPEPGMHLFALHLAGRYSYAVASSFLFFVSIVTMVVGGAVVVIYAGWRALAISVVAFAVLSAGLVHSVVNSDLGRSLIVDRILKVADGVPLLTSLKSGAGTDSFIANLAGFNTGVGVLSVGLLLSALYVITVRDPSRTPKLPELKRRLVIIRLTLALGSALLVVAVLSSRTLVDWPISLLVDPQRAAIKPLTDALLNAWGAGYTLTLFSAFAPALASWWIDVGRFRADAAKKAEEAKAAPKKTEAKNAAKSDAKSDDGKKDKPADDGLEFAPLSALASLFAVLAPLLASPFVDALKGIVGAAGGK